MGRACGTQQGTEGVISESFPLFYFMCLIIHQVFSKIPLSCSLPRSWHSVSIYLELICLYELQLHLAIINMLPCDIVGIAVLLLMSLVYFFGKFSAFLLPLFSPQYQAWCLTQN